MKTQIFSILFAFGVLLSNVLLAEENTFFHNSKEDIQSVKVYPNPVSNKGYLTFSMNQSSLVKIEFYDLSGKKVKELKEVYLNEGEQKVDFEVNELNIGIYLCKIKTKNWEKAKRIIIKR